MHYVEIILKVSERCNLNCTYCYFFNKENRDFEGHPALISPNTVRHLVRFLRTSPHQISETVFQVGIHGGEPLLLGPKRFSEIVSIIENGLSDAKEVRFTVQTNAVLINEAWIDVFAQHKIFVGVSVDGPKGQHDANRIDRRGRGTFDSMVPKIAALKQAALERRIPGFGSISVVSPALDGRATYICLTKELHFAHLQFLFPDDTHDSTNPALAEGFAKFVEDLFASWQSDGNDNIHIKLIDQTLLGFLQDKQYIDGGRRISPAVGRVVFTVSSAGDIGHDDTLRNVAPELFKSGMNVSDANYAEFIVWHNRVSKILFPRDLAPPCASCAWNNICEHVTRSYTPLHRMKDGRVDQPSVYCEALKTAYRNGAEYLAKRGLPIREISKNLNPDY
ncbi:radical SAM protein [Bordetella bronchialis]|uniref:radical SAM protein n=1 Tax=Bordetella bronchialis TaxID=463025 RepID=UPI0009F4BE59|nr:radical SAM protein [Bordetella bronchialis]